ncbi:hypothetical protein QE442_003747 [Chryseobacterium sp. SORGH_AS1175]|nr:hypothetical protein [Chryseobacterium sp. SORGH_AS_1048]MDR6132861.1 hypothetical protein [Chryseobacterium sp. SORGH_AS_1175]
MIRESRPFKKSIQWCSFTLLINRNSIFLFPKKLYFIPDRAVNLFYSNYDKKYTRHPMMLRKLTLSKNNVELVYYADSITGPRKIQLYNLTEEQLSIFQEIKKRKNYY